MKIFPGSIIDIVSAKVCKGIGILYRTRYIRHKLLRQQLYLSFLNCYLNFAKIAWANTNKSKLQALYHHHKHASRIRNFKDKVTSSEPLLEQINAMTLYEMNICKNGDTLSILKHLYTLKPRNIYATRSKAVLLRKAVQNLR